MTTTDTPPAGIDRLDAADPDREPRDTATRLRRDVEQLVGFDRRTLGWGERESARYLTQRLTEIGAQDVATATFRTQSSWVPAHLSHLLIAVGLALLPHRAARLLGAAVALSYELEVSGRVQWVRRVLPARRGTSAWAHIPARGHSQRTLVLVAHHDAAHTGVIWHPSAVAGSRNLARMTGRTLPSHAITLAALSAAAMPSRRARMIGGGGLAASAVLMIQSMRSATAPGANDNASGVAAVLEVARQLVSSPLPDTTVLVVFPGGEEAGNTGIRDWLRKNRSQLDPQNTLVVNLDAVGSRGCLGIAHREGLTNRSSTDSVRRARRAAAQLGLSVQDVTCPNATDAAVMTNAGLPTVSVLSVEDGWISNLHRSSDTVDNVDWTTVQDAVRLTRHIATTWVAEHSAGER